MWNENQHVLAGMNETGESARERVNTIKLYIWAKITCDNLKDPIILLMAITGTPAAEDKKLFATLWKTTKIAAGFNKMLESLLFFQSDWTNLQTWGGGGGVPRSVKH